MRARATAPEVATNPTIQTFAAAAGRWIKLNAGTPRVWFAPKLIKAIGDDPVESLADPNRVISLRDGLYQEYGRATGNVAYEVFITILALAGHEVDSKLCPPLPVPPAPARQRYERREKAAHERRMAAIGRWQRTLRRWQRAFTLNRVLDPDGDRLRDVWLTYAVPLDPRFADDIEET